MEHKKNDIVTVKIEDMGSEGEGIGKIGGYTLFVKDAVIGDVVSCKIMKAKKSYAYARLMELLTPSPFRDEPACRFHRQCGGCQLQALCYEKQLEFKQNRIRNHLIRIGGFEEAFVDRVLEPVVGMENPWRYRNKAQYPVGTDRDGNPAAGFYAARTHTIVANTECMLGAESNSKILETVLQYMRENHVPAYDEASGKGLIRHVLIRSGFTSGQIMVCLVICPDKAETVGKRSQKAREELRGNAAAGQSLEGDGKSESKGNGNGDDLEEARRYLPAGERLVRPLSEIPGMTSVSVSINTERTNVIMGKEIHTIWGSDTIMDTIHVRDASDFSFTGQSLDFRISPLSFYQVNPVQTEKLYSLALEYAGLTGRETVWDLYCGIGTISLFLAGKARQVYGVEIVPQAVVDARRNAEENGIGNAAFYVGKAEEVLPKKFEKEGIRADVIVVDPPRKGCDSACLDTMLKMRPERIVYVSCDSATLARDLRVLCDGGYEVVRARGVDQFPGTVHVETVCLLSKNK